MATRMPFGFASPEPSELFEKPASTARPENLPENHYKDLSTPSPFTALMRLAANPVETNFNTQVSKPVPICGSPPPTKKPRTECYPAFNTPNSKPDLPEIDQTMGFGFDKTKLETPKREDQNLLAGFFSPLWNGRSNSTEEAAIVDASAAVPELSFSQPLHFFGFSPNPVRTQPQETSVCIAIDPLIDQLPADALFQLSTKEPSDACQHMYRLAERFLTQPPRSPPSPPPIRSSEESEAAAIINSLASDKSPFKPRSQKRARNL